MIPRKIHYCWFGNGDKNILITRCISSWSQHLPNYEIKLWNEQNINFDTPFLKEMKEKKQWAFISDYIRMRVLHNEGGIYLDTDVEVIKSFDTLLDNDCFLGYESKNRLNTAVLGAEKEHPLLEKCMSIIDSRHAEGLEYMIAPQVASSAYEQLSNLCKVTTYAEEFFYPYNPYDIERPTQVLMYKDITEKTYAIHHWNKSWKTNKVAKLAKVITNACRKIFNA